MKLSFASTECWGDTAGRRVLLPGSRGPFQRHQEGAAFFFTPRPSRFPPVLSASGCGFPKVSRFSVWGAVALWRTPDSDAYYLGVLFCIPFPQPCGTAHIGNYLPWVRSAQKYIKFLQREASPGPSFNSIYTVAPSTLYAPNSLCVPSLGSPILWTFVFLWLSQSRHYAL